MDKKKILIIDDDQSQLELLEIFLSASGYVVRCAATAHQGLRADRLFAPDLIILDVHLPDKDGLEVLQDLRKKNQDANIIIITAYHDMETTVKAIKSGACEYITKPIDVDELEKAVKRTLKLSTVSGQEVRSLDHGIAQKGPIIGKSNVMKEIFKTIGMLSRNRVTVLVEGETGTGKELIAKAIHDYSPNKDHPFMAINCSAIVETLLESELFGHEKGAFTGAFDAKKGKFELAGDGTIFLNEVGEIPFEPQAKLLRFLQTKEYQRVGGQKNLKSNARIIAATNRDLWQMVTKGAFRDELFYRLSVAKIHVPPLRNRKEDIGLLVEYLLKKINGELGTNIRKVEEKAMLRMTEYEWPGNVRQLENELTRAAIITHGDVILDEALVTLLAKEGVHEDNAQGAPLSLQEMERQHILKMLNHTGWRLGKTAGLLGVSRPTLRLKMREYKIVPKR